MSPRIGTKENGWRTGGENASTNQTNQEDSLFNRPKQRTTDGFLAGFFMPKPKPLLETKMAVTRRGERRKGNRRQSSRRKGDIEKITIRGERDKEQEVVVRHEAVPEKKVGSVWSWYEEYAAELSGTYITKKKRGKPKQGK